MRPILRNGGLIKAKVFRIMAPEPRVQATKAQDCISLDQYLVTQIQYWVIFVYYLVFSFQLH